MIALAVGARLLRPACVGATFVVIAAGFAACSRPAHADSAAATQVRDDTVGGCTVMRLTITCSVIAPTVDTCSGATVADDGPAPMVASPSMGVLQRPSGALKPPHDLRDARPPRHRGERPTSATHLLGTTLVRRLFGVLNDVGERRFVVPPAAVMPLAGHPLLLLRPPAAIS
jgi:hypothetical protein